MRYNVAFTGTFREGADRARVTQALASLFGRDVALIERLVAGRATIKRGVDEATARRFREAIESAGAGCVVAPEQDALTIDVPEPAPASASTAQAPSATAEPREETTLLEFGPSPVAFAGQWALGAVLLLAWGLGLIVWAFAIVSWKSSHYRLTTERLFARRGFFSRQVHELEMFRVKDVTLHQSLIERLFGIGTVTVHSSDATTPALALAGIASPETVKETLRKLARESRKREGVRVGERIID